MEEGTTSPRMQAYWIMTTPVQTVRMTDTLRDVAILFNEKNISAAAVLDAHRNPVGVITKTDLIRHEQKRDEVEMFNERYSMREGLVGHRGLPLVEGPDKVEQWMTPVIFSVKPETPMKEIARRMVKYGIHHIFVRGKNGESLAGIVSSFDILKQVAMSEMGGNE